MREPQMREIADIMAAGMDDLRRRSEVELLRNRVYELTAQFDVP